MGWAFGIYGLGPLVQLIIIIYIFFELVSLYTIVIPKTVCQFSNVYFHSLLFMKIYFGETLLERKHIVHSFESKREKDIE